MKQFLKSIDWYVHATMIVSIALVIASFIVPPTGIIEPSVLASIGELGGMAALFTFLAKLPQYIESGVKAKITHNDTTIEIGRKDNEETDDEDSCCAPED